MADMIFADGLIVKKRDGAPDFVVCNLSIKVDEFIPWLDEHRSNGWVNLDVKISKNGKMYASKDTWEPTQGDAAREGIANAREAAAPAPAPAPSEFDDDIPF